MLKFKFVAAKPVEADPDGPSLLPDYKVYELTLQQRILTLIAGGLLMYGIGYLFYHHWLLSLLLMPGGAYAPHILRNYLLKRRRNALNLQFKQTLFSLSSSLSAGRSVENAFREAVQDLRMLDPEGSSDMISELNIICARMEYGQPVEEALRNFSERAGMEDIERFADVFSVCKRTGGDLVEVVRRTSTIIGEKLDIQQDIAVSIAQKKFEAKALLISPLIMVMFMSLTAGEYMQPMYTGAGIAISTIALVALFLCYLWTTKIMDIPL
ncbi:MULTISPECIES: type II secretion system F family protein [Paenibacillus]|uniref:Pilus assembly protein TadB n=1 Tax=Paenibacillus odorifer TaxID=189426 RepID=A0A1R0WZU1_9BACL|nr:MULTISPECIES: type II secretion system F family protein [Paenibacillus]ETT60255.1 Flp pilus assembly protein TadB [Paenibacillus sp. FSL H8-237]OMD25255.1 pilus assembly protein TadB [Paenibacillus odorifer]OME13778.1 pilus assembly protein TadB [Paenibacillus odorifer]OME25445.1 pilus assembly protein TadB [Paenibacillus odorifer]OME30523.1 pilus assembly protein TadB [Paenibacillus odorifer]